MYKVIYHGFNDYTFTRTFDNLAEANKLFGYLAMALRVTNAVTLVHGDEVIKQIVR